MFDKDGNGFISPEELLSAMETFRGSVSQEELDETMRKADLDKDGRLNYREFAKMMN